MSDIAAKISPRRGSAVTSVTAAGSGDNQAVTGVIIDRAALNWPSSVAICVPYSATLAQGKVMKFKAATLQHSDASDLTGAAAYATLEAAAGSTIATGATGGSTEVGLKEYSVPSLLAAKRYVRFDFTPDLDATGTDTATIGNVVLVFGGSYKGPAA